MMLDTLPKIPFFEDLADEQVETLKEFFDFASYPFGASIIAQGEAAIYLYLIVCGTVAIHYKPYDGPPLILTRLRAGDAFGWSAIVGSRFYASTIITESEVEVIRIKGSQVRALIQHYPETGRLVLDRLASSVSPRWRNAHQQVEALMNSR